METIKYRPTGVFWAGEIGWMGHPQLEMLVLSIDSTHQRFKLSEDQ